METNIKVKGFAVKREINDIDDIVNIVKATGNHFFDKNTMAFFKSKYYGDVHIGKRHAYFITSEKHNDLPRLFTLRFLVLRGKNGGGIHEITPSKDITPFQAFDFLNSARSMLKKIAENKVRFEMLKDWHKPYFPDCDLLAVDK